MIFKFVLDMITNGEEMSCMWKGFGNDLQHV